MELKVLQAALLLQSPAIILGEASRLPLPPHAEWRHIPSPPGYIPGSVVRGALGRLIAEYLGLTKETQWLESVSFSSLHPVDERDGRQAACAPPPALSMEVDGRVHVFPSTSSDEARVAELARKLEKADEPGLQALAELAGSLAELIGGSPARIRQFREPVAWVAQRGGWVRCGGVREYTITLIEIDRELGRAIGGFYLGRMYGQPYEALEAGQVFHGLAVLPGEALDAVRELGRSCGGGTYLVEGLRLGKATSMGYGEAIMLLQEAGQLVEEAAKRLENLAEETQGILVFYTISPYAPLKASPRLVVSPGSTLYSRWSSLSATATATIRVRRAGSIVVLDADTKDWRETALKALHGLHGLGPAGVNHALPPSLLPMLLDKAGELAGELRKHGGEAAPA